MLPSQCGKSHSHAGNACYQWLQVVVGAHCGGRKHSLGVGHDDEVNESAHHNDESDFKQNLCGYCLNVKR